MVNTVIACIHTLPPLVRLSYPLSNLEPSEGWPPLRQGRIHFTVNALR